MLLDLAKLELAANEPGAASRICERALTILEPHRLPDPLVPDLKWQLARALWSDRGQRSRALRLARAARDGFAEYQAPQLADVDEWISARE